MGGSLVACALKMLDEYEKENPRDPPKKPSYDDDLYRDSQTNYEEMFGGSFSHGDVMRKLLNSKDHHIFLLRHTARHLRDNEELGGSLIGGNPNVWGAINDIANSRDKLHLVEMVLNDKLMGGDMSGGSFLDTMKKVGSSIVKVGKAVAPFAPLIARGVAMML